MAIQRPQAASPPLLPFLRASHQHHHQQQESPSSPRGPASLRRATRPQSGGGSGVCVDGEGRVYQDFYKMVLENESRTDTPNATGTCMAIVSLLHLALHPHGWIPSNTRQASC